jgi:uncharacterized protein YegP (UPF0339 family)
MKKLLLLFYLLLSLTTLFAQSDLKITGVIRDKANQPIPRVSIAVKKTSINTVTDKDGRYTIQVPAKGKLVFSSCGYKSQKIAVKNNAVIDVLLEENDLSETVAVGYGTQRKEAVTGAIANMRGKNIDKTQDLSTSMNKVPGVQVGQGKLIPIGDTY